MVKTAGKFVTVMLALVVVVVVIGGAARVVASFGAPGNLAPGSKSAMLAAGWTAAIYAARAQLRIHTKHVQTLEAPA